MLLTEKVREWIGREVVYTAPEELGRAAIRYFALAIGDDAPAHQSGEVAPQTLVCETGQYMSGPRSAIGHTWDLPVKGLRMIRGGNDYEFFQPVRPTDVITARWRLEDIKERTSSAGVPMLIVSSEATYTNQNDEVLAKNLETLIYQKP